MAQKTGSLKFSHIRILISFFLFALILYLLDWNNIITSIAKAHVYTLLIAFFLHAIGLIVSVIRWDILLKAVEIKQSFKDLFILYWVSLFYNLFLPTSIGGDIVRVYDLSRSTSKLEGSITSVVMDRLIGMIVLLLIAIIALFAGVQMVYSQLLLWTIIFLAGFIFLLALLLFPSFRKPISVFIPSKIYELIRKKAKQILDSFNQYKNDPKILILTFFWSIILQLNVILYYYLIGKALNIDLQFYHYCIAIPIIQVITLIPVSLSGIGVREIASITVFNQFGIPSEIAFSLSVLSFVLAAVFNSFGGIFLFTHTEKFHPAKIKDE